MHRIAGVVAAVAVMSGLLAFLLWPALLGAAALLSGAAGATMASNDDGVGGLLAAAGLVVGALAVLRAS